MYTSASGGSASGADAMSSKLFGSNSSRRARQLSLHCHSTPTKPIFIRSSEHTPPFFFDVTFQVHTWLNVGGPETIQKKKISCNVTGKSPGVQGGYSIPPLYRGDLPPKGGFKALATRPGCDEPFQE